MASTELWWRVDKEVLAKADAHKFVIHADRGMVKAWYWCMHTLYCYKKAIGTMDTKAGILGGPIR